MATPTTDRLRSIWGTGPDNLIAVGANGTTIRYDGRRWYPIFTGTTKELRAVLGNSPTEWYAVGADGAFLRFDGGGWTDLPVAVTPQFLLGLARGPNGNLVGVGTNRTLVELAH
jgi:hypothetical protein